MMNINLLMMGLMALLAGSFMWSAYWKTEAPEHFLPWVPIDVRKTKVYVSQTRDASMATERFRRLAIQGNRSGGVSYKGSTNGYLEYALTALCFCPKDVCPPAPNVVWDGGTATSEVCDIVDGGIATTEADVVDFGNAFANVCDV